MEKNDQPNRIISVIIALLLAAWLVGVHVADVARLVFAGALLALLLARYRRGAIVLEETFSSPKVFNLLLKIFCVAYVVLIPVYLISKVYAGTHGIDFAIFSQVIENAWPKGKFESSLISSGVVNFMGHHFVPIFIIPGLFGYFGVPSYVSGPVFHAVAVALGACGIFRLGLLLKLSRHLSLPKTRKSRV